MNVPQGAVPCKRRRHRWLPQLFSVVVLAGSAGLITGTPAYAAARTVSFSGHYKGTADLLINNGAVSIPTVRGSGSGTLVGAGKVFGKGSASAAAQCDPFTGTGTLTGKTAKIDLIIVKSTAQGCSNGTSGPVKVTFSGTAKATGGTGAAKGAKGDLKFKGSLDLKGTSGAQNGTYTVTLTGKLSVT